MSGVEVGGSASACLFVARPWLVAGIVCAAGVATVDLAGVAIAAGSASVVAVADCAVTWLRFRGNRVVVEAGEVRLMAGRRVVDRAPVGSGRRLVVEPAANQIIEWFSAAYFSVATVRLSGGTALLDISAKSRQQVEDLRSRLECAMSAEERASHDGGIG